MPRTKVAVAQMTSTEDVSKNLEIASRLVRDAAEERAQLLAFPECFAYLGPERGKLDIAETLPSVGHDRGGPIFEAMSALARTHGIELVLGGFWEKSESADHAYNTSVHLDREGKLRAAYRKIHLFDVDLADGTRLHESSSVRAGRDVVATKTPFGTLGLSICYDVRFPELYRALVDRGAIALSIPAAFTLTTGKDHWHILMRARAIESQAYVLAAAQFGRHFGERRSYGHALIADPWGTIVAECGDGEGLAVGYVDPEVVGKIRASLPSLAHRTLGR